MIFKRSLSLLIASVMMFVICGNGLSIAQKLATAIAEAAVTDEAMPEYKHIEYDYRKGLGESVTEMNMTDQLSFDYSDDMWFSGTKVADAEKMNADIIKLSVALACSAYYDYEAPVNERTRRINTLFKEMGFYDTSGDNSQTSTDENTIGETADTDVTTSLDNYSALDAYNVDIPTLDDCNTAGYYIGHKEIEHQGEKYILYAVPVKGTSADLEWFANMRLGPGQDHKGFYDAAETVYYALDDVVAKTGSEYDKDHRIFLFTGHSRGAAVANIVAGKLSVEEKLAPRNQIFAYTFACPAVSKRADDTLMNIYNFNNPIDIVPLLPMEEWGYKRFGQTVTLKTEGAPYENFLQQYHRVAGEKYKGELNESMTPQDILSAVPEEAMRYLTIKNEKTANFFYSNLIYKMLLDSNKIYDEEDIKYYVKRIISEDTFKGNNNDNDDFIDRMNEAEDLDELTKDHLEKCSSYRDELERFREEILNTEDNADAIAKVLEDRKSVSKLIYSFLLMPNPFDKLGLDKMIREKIVSEIDKALSRIDGYENLLDIVKVAKNVINYACGAPNAHCMVTYVHWINSLFCGGDAWRGYDRLSYSNDICERNTFDIKNQEFIAKPSGRKFHPGCGSYISPKCFVDAGLRKIVFPENMNIQIGESAFAGSKFSVVNFPDNIKRIGKSAFTRSAIEKATIGNAEYYGKGMFEECGLFKELSIENADLTPALTDEDAAKTPVDLFSNTQGTYSVDTRHIIEKITIRNGTDIPKGAFYSLDRLKTAILPDSIKYIGDDAFSYCHNLSEFEMPKSIEYIGDLAFCYCQSLPDISFGKNLKHIGVSAFTACSSLTDVTLPDHMDYIGAGAFRNCGDLINAKIGTVDWIGRSVLKGCNALKNLTLADTHLTPKNIKEDDYHADVPRDLLFGRDTNGDYTSTESLETITITHDTDIAPESFANLHAKTITLPKGTKTIGEDAFSGSDLQKLNWDKLTSLEVIGDRAFERCMSLNERIILPESVTSIGDYAFSNCRYLPTITFGKNLKTIGVGVFTDTNIKEFTIPESVTSIGAAAFADGAVEDIYILNPKCSIYDDESTISTGYYGQFSGTVHGYDGSTAQAYAEKYGKKFVSLGAQSTTQAPTVQPTTQSTSGNTQQTTSAITLKSGDANGDNDVNMSDVVIVMQASLNPKKYGVNGTSPDRITAEGEKAGDVDGKEGLSANDALIIQRYSLKLIDTL